MIKERYCSYEVSKLLKEKGFDVPCSKAYMNDSMVTKSSVQLIDFNSKGYVSAPTHQMAMDWLRIKHGILISIIPQEVNIGVDRLCYAIYRITEDLYQPLYNGKVDNLVDSYKDTAETALKYSLTELI